MNSGDAMSNVRRSDLACLHPEFRAICERLLKNLTRLHKSGELQLRFEVFETCRSIGRQQRLFAEGVTKARGNQSPHNFGLACDFVPNLNQLEARALGRKPGWYWPEISDPSWKILQQQAAMLGLKTIPWDKPHVEHPDWKLLRGWRD